jgi:hypothetical protein
MLPSQYWRRNFAITFEDDPLGIMTRDFIGTETMMWDNDYPHGDSVFPHSQQVLSEILSDCTDEERWQMTAKNEAEPWFMPMDDRSVINLEHVLPRKPEGNWPEFSDDDVDLFSTRLGNLALLRATDNSDLKSQAFAEKKQLLANSPYLLTSQIGDLEDWTPAAITERQKKLAELAVRTWPTK